MNRRCRPEADNRDGPLQGDQRVCKILGDSVRAVLDREKIRRMESGAINQVIGRVTIRVADFVGSIECDAAGYSVTFLELERQPNVLVANLTTGAEEGC